MPFIPLVKRFKIENLFKGEIIGFNIKNIELLPTIDSLGKDFKLFYLTEKNTGYKKKVNMANKYDRKYFLTVGQLGQSGFEISESDIDFTIKKTIKMIKKLNSMQIKNYYQSGHGKSRYSFLKRKKFSP